MPERASADGARTSLGDDAVLVQPVRPVRSSAIPRSVARAGGAAADIFADSEVHERDRRREQRLVEAACRGEESAIEALYRTHFDTIYRYVLLATGLAVGR